MVINNWVHSQSALEHYVYSFKDHDKVWQWSCPAHLKQWLADNLQETGAGAGVIKSSPKDKAANWPCSNHWEAAAGCALFAFLPASYFSPLPGAASASWQGWRVTGRCSRHVVQARHQWASLSLLSVRSTPCVHSTGCPRCCWDVSVPPQTGIHGTTSRA